MGNYTDEGKWDHRARLEFVEKLLWWQGSLQRADLVGRFGISTAQASSDLVRYMEINPGAAIYNPRRKRYEASPEMECILKPPTLGDQVEPPTATAWPRNQAPDHVQRRLVLALLAGHVIRVTTTDPGDLDVIPGGLDQWEGRWFLRAWLPAAGVWITLQVDRITSAAWPEKTKTIPPADPDWGQMDSLKLRLMDPAAELDYTVSAGLMEVSHRRALSGEVLARLPAGFQIAGD